MEYSIKIRKRNLPDWSDLHLESTLRFAGDPNCFERLRCRAVAIGCGLVAAAGLVESNQAVRDSKKDAKVQISQ